MVTRRFAYIVRGERRQCSAAAAASAAYVSLLLLIADADGEQFRRGAGATHFDKEERERERGRGRRKRKEEAGSRKRKRKRKEAGKAAGGAVAVRAWMARWESSGGSWCVRASGVRVWCVCVWCVSFVCLRRFLFICWLLREPKEAKAKAPATPLMDGTTHRRTTPHCPHRT